ncbi:MAG TPA: CopG family transcriptional regulator [Polyangia bacterium]|nr:CopG family transcriptional regulator [Polyangia bacterium]
MRTTIALDDDLATKLQDMAHRRRVSFRQIVDEVLRKGLSGQERPRASKSTYRTETFDSGFRPGVDPQRLNQLLDDLEADRFGGRRR